MNRIDRYRLSREDVNGSVFVNGDRVVRFIAEPDGVHAALLTEAGYVLDGTVVRGRLELKLMGRV